MLIDNANSLNEWLINVLEPICDADPQALAKYILALIKKDKTPEELRKVCLEQLEVFLVNETRSFVDILFDTLKNKSYLVNDQASLNNTVEQQTSSRSPKSHRNVPAPSGSSRRRRSRSRSIGKSYKRNRSRSPQQENYHGYNKSRRCRDYDEKGYCMRGNLCTYDHGVNPLILDSTNANTVLNMTTSVNNQNSTLLPTPNNNQYTPSNLANEPYNPEAPAIDTSRLNKNFNSQSTNNNNHQQQYRPTVNNVHNDNRNGMNKNNVYLYDNDDQYSGKRNQNRSFKPNNKRKLQSSIENSEKTTLEVRKIPAQMNTIANLNEHFSKFGTITNLKIGYDNDLEAALVQYSSNSEALAAYRSTEAVLNNRFIKVFWHSSGSNTNQSEQRSNKDAAVNDSNNESSVSERAEAKKQSIKDRLGGIAEKQASITNSAVSNLINSGLINSNTPNQLAALMMSTGNANSKLINKVSTTSIPVSKPVFNPALLKKQYTPVSTTNNNSSSSVSNTTTTTTAVASTVPNTCVTKAQTAQTENLITSAKITTKPFMNSISTIKQQQTQPNKEKLMRKLELQKKRQEMLSTSIQQNRLLIDKLEKAKTDLEKQSIRETLLLLSKQIKQLEEQIKRENSLIMEETNLQKQLSVA